ncbi:hypothetical protein BH10BAC5_BH10BAC5_16960 [soil metagenome]
MAIVKFGIQNAGEIISELQTRSKAFVDTAISPELILGLVNDVVAELNAIEGDNEKTERQRSFVIPQTKYVIFDAVPTGGYVSSTRRLTIPLTDSGAADLRWVNDADGFDSTWVGASVRWQNEDTGILYVTEIESIVSATVVVLKAISPTIPDQSGDLMINGFITVGGQADSIQISNMDDYQYFDYVLHIEDSLTPMREIKSREEFVWLKQTRTFNKYKREIIWNRKGEFIEFCKGLEVASYGVRTMTIVFTPIRMIADTDIIDVNPSGTSQVKSLTLFRVLEAKAATKMPQDAMLANNTYVAKQRAIAEEKAKKKD